MRRAEPRESEIQKTIIEGLAAKHIFAFRLNTAAMKVGKRFFRAHSLGAGAADILALPVCDTLRVIHEDTGTFGPKPSAIVWIECKSAKGELSEEQKSFRGFVTSKGHRHLVARSWEDVEEFLEKHGL